MGNTVTRSVARREEVMPVPEGQITGSNTWTETVEEPLENYEVVEVCKIRKRVVLSASSEENALFIAKDYFATNDDNKYDTFVSEYTIEAKIAR